MNFVKLRMLFAYSWRIHKYSLTILLLLLAISLSGCSDNVTLPSKKELTEFKNAGYEEDTVKRNPYRVATNEVLELTMPTILQVMTADEPSGSGQDITFKCRISDDGTISLPAVGEVKVAGKTLSEIETLVAEAYYPEYTPVRPNIFIRLDESLELPLFSVFGLVNKPGNFTYPPDVQYNLMQALGFAGGLSSVAEPHYATIYRLKQDGTIASAIFQVANTDEQSMLTEAMNIKIKPGDIIDVQHTPRTRSNEFLKGVFKVNIGTYFRLEELWQD